MVTGLQHSLNPIPPFKTLTKVSSDEEPEWRALESRLLNRKHEKESVTGLRGRVALKKSEDDYWADTGLYND